MKNTLSAIFILIVLLWGGYAFHFGYVMSPDSHTYSRWADVLIAHNFNIISYQHSVDFPVPPYLYLGFVTVVALAKVAGGIFWPWLIVILNVILGAFVGVMIADVVYLLTRNKLSVWITVFLYAFNPEIILWPRYVLSDVSYMFVNFLIFYYVTKLYISARASNIKFWVLIVAVLIINYFYRPGGIVMVPVALVAFYLYLRKNRISWKWFFGIFAGIILIALVVHTMVIKNINLWPFQFGKIYLKDFVVSFYQKGVVIHDRPHTYHHIPAVFLDYFSITVDKLFSFFYFSDRLFSVFHKLVNYFVFLPLYFFAIMGIVCISKEKREAINRSLIALCVILIISYSVYHAMTVIDFDWRYRLPVLPYILVVSGMGVKFLLPSKRGEER